VIDDGEDKAAAQGTWAGSRELASYGALPLVSFRTVLEGLRDAGRDVGPGTAAAEDWLERLDPADPVHCQAAIGMSRSLEQYAVSAIVRAPEASAEYDDLRGVTAEMTQRLHGEGPEIATARHVFALAYDLAARLRSGRGDKEWGESVIRGLVTVLGESLLEVVNDKYPDAKRLYEDFGAVPDAGVTALLWA